MKRVKKMYDEMLVKKIPFRCLELAKKIAVKLVKEKAAGTRKLSTD